MLSIECAHYLCMSARVVCGGAVVLPGLACICCIDKLFGAR